jgi:hypothetical protein
VDTEDEDDE